MPQHHALRNGSTRRLKPGRDRFGLLSLFVLIISLVGCGDDDRPELFPLTGTVAVNGQPAHGAIVTLHSEKSQPLGTPKPFGRADAEGRFQLTTFETSDGVPAGDYRVTVIWPENPQARGPSPDRLSGRYASQESSPLTVAVSEGMTELPALELEGK